MPRRARVKSKNDIYHIMLRGIDKQNIFEDEEDKEKFLSVLTDCKAISEYKVFAYCFMNNHVHILLQTGKEELGKVFRRIGARYVYWYNWKYQRTGHLFQDRYKSEAVEDDSYFITVIKYIHQNPIVAEIVERAEDYNYSSYKEYMINKAGTLIDKNFVYSIINKKEFIKIHEEKSAEVLKLDQRSKRKTDEEAKAIIRKICKKKDLKEMTADKTAKCIQQIQKEGVSVRQLSRLTGLSKGVIERNLKT